MPANAPPGRVQPGRAKKHRKLSLSSSPSPGEVTAEQPNGEQLVNPVCDSSENSLTEQAAETVKISIFQILKAGWLMI